MRDARPVTETMRTTDRRRNPRAGHPARRRLTGHADQARPRRRLTAEARTSYLLAAARRAFTETGEINGITIKAIAEHSGISEGVIYRHFESKDQLFFEAVVEPLKKAVDDLAAARGRGSAMSR